MTLTRVISMEGWLEWDERTGEEEEEAVSTDTKSQSFFQPSGKFNLLAKYLFSSSFPAHYLKRHFSPGQLRAVLGCK